MIVVMNSAASEAEVAGVVRRVTEIGCTPHLSTGSERTIVGVIGNHRPTDGERLASLNGVARVVPIMAPYKLASRDLRPHDTIVRIGDIEVGGGAVAIMAGPCSVESREQLLDTAAELSAMGVRILRGGAFKPRTSPYSFQGMGEEGLRILAEARNRFGMAIVTEVMTAEEVELVASYADILQIGTRNMQNYRLLEAAGRQHKPVLLKRGMSATVEELLMAAEYVLASGNPNVMLCERGIRTFEPSARASFDLNAIPVLKSLTHLPVLADPSHATGRADLVPAVSMGAVAAGADGLILESHLQPELALSDGSQSLRPGDLGLLLARLQVLGGALGRTIDVRTSPARRAAGLAPAGNAA